MGLRERLELSSAAPLLTGSQLPLPWRKPGPGLHRCSFSVVLKPDETALGGIEKELKNEGIDLKDVDKTAEETQKADLKELNLKELKELELKQQEPQDPDRHEFVVPRLPKKSIPQEAKEKEEEVRVAPERPPGPPGPPGSGPPLPGPPDPYYDEEAPYADYEAEYEEEPDGVPLLDQDLQRADIRYDSKVDPQLNRIADQVNSKIDMVEQRLLGDSLQNLVVPFPASDASHDASTVRVFLGNPSTTTPDVGTPLDEVNQLLQKADSIEKGLVPTSNLQVQQGIPAVAILASLLTGFASGSPYARSQPRTAGFL